ncbi:MAG: hypothetical protein OXU69_12780 [Gemmatimonadota bacterium]|nr:hypothetical protein [Gemmatimonadota bacterium]MDE2985573.1 hypothetical protein [Gemmatimonadota bacterium]
MSDPYREATRNETGRRSPLSGPVLLAGGVFMSLLIAVLVWMVVGRGGSFEASPGAVTELNFRQATARAAAVGAVMRAPRPRTGLQVGVTHGLADARQLSRAAAAVLGSILEDEGYTVTPRDEHADFSLDVTRQTGDRTRSDRLSIPVVADRIERVTRRDSRLMSGAPGLPNWVPVYPGARMFVRGSRHSTGALDYVGLVAEAGAGEIVDWYEDVARWIEEDVGDPSLQAERRVATVRMGPDGRVRERFAMRWDDRMVSLVITEDEYGDSMVVLIFRG